MSQKVAAVGSNVDYCRIVANSRWMDLCRTRLGQGLESVARDSAFARKVKRMFLASLGGLARRSASAF